MGHALRVGEQTAAGSGWGARAGWTACRGGREHLLAIASSASARAEAAKKACLSVDRALATFALLEGLAPARRLGHCLRAASEALGAAEPAEDWEIGLNLMAIDVDGVTFAGTGAGLLAPVRCDARVRIARRRERGRRHAGPDGWVGLRPGRKLESWTIAMWHAGTAFEEEEAAIAGTGGRKTSRHGADRRSVAAQRTREDNGCGARGAVRRPDGRRGESRAAGGRDERSTPEGAPKNGTSPTRRRRKRPSGTSGCPATRFGSQANRQGSQSAADAGNDTAAARGRKEQRPRAGKDAAAENADGVWDYGAGSRGTTRRDGGDRCTRTLRLAADRIADLPALRAHQEHDWHTVLVQLAALVCAKEGIKKIPERRRTWKELLRTLTGRWRNDTPWPLVGSTKSRWRSCDPPRTPTKSARRG